MSHAARAAALVCLLAAAAVRAEDGESSWQLDAGIPVGWIGGHTTYEIHGSDARSSVRSKLEFPLQGVLAGVRARLGAPRGDDGGRWFFEASAQHTLTEQTGTLKDSDWLDGAAETAAPPDGVGAAHPGLDIFSTSKAFLRALVVEGRVSWERAVTPALRLAPLAGVLYQDFGYTVVDVHQVGYGPWAAFSGSTSGRVLTYDVSYRAVYVGARCELSDGPLGVAVDAWYSPFVQAKDEDDHVLRSKLSKTVADGSGWQARAEGRLALGPLDAVSLQGSVVGISATGTQTQRFYAGTYMGQTAVIDATLTSLRWTAGLAWTHRLP